MGTIGVQSLFQSIWGLFVSTYWKPMPYPSLESCFQLKKFMSVPFRGSNPAHVPHTHTLYTNIERQNERGQRALWDLLTRGNAWRIPFDWFTQPPVNHRDSMFFKPPLLFSFSHSRGPKNVSVGREKWYIRSAQFIATSKKHLVLQPASFPCNIFSPPGNVGKFVEDQILVGSLVNVGPAIPWVTGRCRQHRRMFHCKPVPQPKQWCLSLTSQNH